MIRVIGKIMEFTFIFITSFLVYVAFIIQSDELGYQRTITTSECKDMMFAEFYDIIYPAYMAGHSGPAREADTFAAYSNAGQKAVDRAEKCWARAGYPLPRGLGDFDPGWVDHIDYRLGKD